MVRPPRRDIAGTVLRTMPSRVRQPTRFTRSVFNDEQLEHDEATISMWRYATTAQFWFESVQTWQS